MTALAINSTPHFDVNDPSIDVARARLSETDGSLRELVLQLVSAAPNAYIDERHDDATWILVTSSETILPRQGWKLHLTANPKNAVQVLRTVVPLLTAHGTTFKFARSLGTLHQLNQGESGFSQIGKFMTIYPVSDGDAVELARLLDRATREFSGPVIPSDRQLTPDSIVYYRYGGFDGRFMQTPLGEILPAIENPAGELEPDRRGTRYHQPEWITDPFAEAGIRVEQEPEASPLIGNRFLPLALLHGSPRGAVHLAFDTRHPRACVLKQARKGGAIDRAGKDACDHLRHEFHILQQLSDDPRFPRVYDLHEYNGDLFLAMEDVAGKTLGAHVNAGLNTGILPDGETVIRMGLDLVSLIETMHLRNFVFRDLKSTNVIVTTQGNLRLIDFELALELDGQEHQRFGYGTPGYMSPQQLHGEAPAFSDDIYGLGALLYQMATGAEPALAADYTDLLSRPVQLLNPTIGDDLSRIIEKCLAPAPEDRFTSAANIATALGAANGRRTHPGFGAPLPAHDESSARRHSRHLANRLAETLIATSEVTANGSGIFWRSTHPQTHGFLSRDLNTGNAGTVLALAELASELQTPELQATLAGAARWLQTAPKPEGTPLVGLYVGEGATAAALLRTGQVLGDPALIQDASQRAARIATAPHTSPDLFNGTAGRIRLHLWMYEETLERDHLRHAIDGGDHLLCHAIPGDNDEITWNMPEGYASLSGPLGLGYAHGTSGVCDVLLDLFEVSGDARYREAARKGARWIARQTRPALADGSGAMWPDTEGTAAVTGFWCHGAPGIGQFMLHGAKHDLLPGAGDLAIAAACTAGQTVRFAGPTQCHGLAGNIEFLLDVFQSIGDERFLHEARTLETLMHAFSREENGKLIYCSDFQNVYSPDYVVGYAGVAVALLRLADPERLPRQLSRAGFRPSGIGNLVVA